MTVIICDDEPRICALIQRLVDWDNLPICLLGLAYNGEEALDLIRDKKPDIVITDIRMPGLDGMELIQQVRKAGLPTKFVIISGYRHFEYAHAALQYGVESYLLKPIRKQELNHILQKICEAGKRQAAHSPGLLRRHFIANLLFGDCPEHEFSIPLANELCGLHFTDGDFAVLALCPDYPECTEERSTEMLEDLLEKMTVQCQHLFHETVCVAHTGMVFAVVNGSFANDLTTLAESIYGEAESWGHAAGVTLTLGAGGVYSTFSGIIASLWEAVECLQCRLALGVGKAIAYQQLVFSEASLEDLLGHEWRGRWTMALESMDLGNVESMLKKYFRQMEKHQHLDPRRYYEISAYFLSTAFEPPFTGGTSMERSEQERKIRQQLLECNTPECMQVKLAHWLQEHIKRQASISDGQDRLPIRLAKRYIKDHYMTQLTLEEVANEVHFNPNYLSCVFKSEMGINFTDYLVQVRVDAAKVLLRNDNRRVEQIAEEVGYQNVKYFSRLFRKVTGITPSKYRSLY